MRRKQRGGGGSDDYLDSAGTEPFNFLTDEPYRDVERYRKEAAVWSTFPMYADKELLSKLKSALESTQVTIVVSGTGSGKTVIVPKVAAKVAKMLAKKNGGGGEGRWNVAVTNPKSTTTLANAEYAARCMDVGLGAEVGYRFRGSPRSSSSKDATKLLYLTDGYLLAQARRDPMLSEYSCIIVDEAHERPPPVDFILQASFNILKQREDFRLIVMSATIDTEVFVSYFEKRNISVATIVAEGVKMHEVTHAYEPPGGLDKGSATEYFKAGMAHVERILKDEDGGPGGDVLWFVPTSGDAVAGCKAFGAFARGSCNMPACAATLCTELYSKASNKQKEASLTPPPDPFVRKVIFATNVAESSFTFKGLGYVIDSGLELTSKWDAARRCQVISRRFTTQAQITQREGRVGRTGPGKVYHLYSEKHRKSLKSYPDPHIIGIDITQEVLAMMASKSSVDGVAEACGELLTPPKPEQLASALSLLHFYRCIASSVPAEGGGSRSGAYDRAHWAAAAGKSIDAVRGVLPGATLTPMGALVDGVMTGGQLSPWQALLVVIGAINDEGAAAMRMACILEETASDPGAMMPVSVIDAPAKDAARVPSTLDPSLRAGASAHLTLARILAFVEETPDPDAFIARTGMSHSFWSRVAARAGDRRARETLRVIGDGLASAASHPSVAEWRRAFDALGESVDLGLGEGITEAERRLARIVVLARSMHLLQAASEDRKTYAVPFHAKEMSVRFTDIDRGAMKEAPIACVSEQFVDTKNDGKLSAGIITSFPQETAAAILAAVLG